MIDKNIQNLICRSNISIKDAMIKLEKSQKKILCVIENNKLIGLLNDGDIRRSILKGFSPENKITSLINKKPITATTDHNMDEIKILMKKKKIVSIPILNNGKIYRIITFDELFDIDILNFNIVILAGGLGKRLLPLTKKIPKTLVSINNKKIIDLIIERFFKYNLKDITLLTHHLHSKIKKYLNDHYKKNKINIIKEKKPLGTCGGLSLLNKYKLTENIILINTDVITGINFRDLINHHINTKADLTIVSKKESIQLKYGEIEFEKRKFEIINIKEKPLIEVNINAGIYVINKKCLNFIPKNKKMDINKLFEILRRKKFKIKIYPSYEYWYDIGNKDDLKKCKSFLAK